MLRLQRRRHGDVGLRLAEITRPPQSSEVVDASNKKLFEWFDSKESRVMASTIMALPAAYAEQLAQVFLAVDEQTLEGVMVL